MKTRYFTSRQREDLFLKAGGLCEICGCILDWSFHADHKYPYILGGKTILSNGQALCQKCNLTKGKKVTRHKIKEALENFNPRDWQKHAKEAVFTELGNNKSALVVANPGAGKTWLAGSIAAEGLLSGAFERFVVVSPTSALKSQWVDELWSCFRIGLEESRPRESAGDDFQGVSVTYQGLASSPENFKKGCEQIGKTLVILDEPHHAGEHKSWGEALRRAFDSDDIKILLLSGTPWRTDGTPIPFAPYDKNNKLLPTFNYGFKDAIIDGVNRVPHFYTFDADKVSWIDLSTGEHIEYSTLELSDKTDSNRAYRTALDEPETIERMFRAANQQLTYFRNNEDFKAGGLLITKDLKAAEAARSMIETMTGQTPRIVHNDIPNPNKVIDEFKHSFDKWIIAVEMISEGIDIKRLRCCVYAHRAKTDLFFRQVVGRFTRKYSKDDEINDQFGYMYMLQNKVLMELAKNIENEVSVAIKELEVIANPPGGHIDPPNNAGILGVDVDLVDGDGVARGRRIDRQALKYVRKLIENDPLLIGMDLMQVVHLLEITGRMEPDLAQKVKQAFEEEEKDQSPKDKKEKLKKQYNQLVKRYIKESGNSSSPKIYSVTFNKFNKRAGFMNVDNASIGQLETAIELVKQALMKL